METNLPIETLFDTVNAHGHRIGRLLIEPVTIEASIGGYELSDIDKHKDKPESSRVLMKSSGVSGIEVDDIILHNRFAGVKFKHEGKEYLVITTDDAYGKFNLDKITVK